MRVHLFPFRTQKLSSSVPKILVWRRTGKIGQCQHKKQSQDWLCFFYIPKTKDKACGSKKLKRWGRHKKLLLLYWACGRPTARGIAKGGHSSESEWHKQFIAYEVKLQIPYCVCAKVQTKRILWRKESGSRKNIAPTVRMEGSKDNWGRSMPPTMCICWWRSRQRCQYQASWDTWKERAAQCCMSNSANWSTSTGVENSGERGITWIW